MNILIIGSGSIGMRHLKNCLALNCNDITVVSRNKTAITDFDNVKVYNSIANAFTNNQVYDAAIVATPSSLHIENTIELINNGVKKIYVEKPVSNTLEFTSDLIQLASEKKVLIFVGYDLKFDPGLNKVKELLDNKTIGNIISVQAEVGQYLPDWRKGTNHKDGMSAKVNLGGGVMLDLIHEFDYLQWLLGTYKKIVGFNKKIEHLDIETEGIAVAIFETNKGVLGMLSLDYIQKELNRNAKFIGDFGTITWDYVTAQVKWKSHTDDNWNSFDYKDFDRNDRFVMIMNAFLKASSHDFDSRLTGLEESLVSLKAVIDSKNSSN